MKSGDCVRVDNVLGTLYGKVTEIEDGPNCKEVTVGLRSNVVISSVTAPEQDITHIGKGWCVDCVWKHKGCTNPDSSRNGSMVGSRTGCDEFKALL